MGLSVLIQAFTAGQRLVNRRERLRESACVKGGDRERHREAVRAREEA